MSTTPATPLTLAPTGFNLWRTRLVTLLPLGAIAGLALVLADHPAVSQYGLSALTLAMCAGMVAANTMPKHWLTPLAPGMQFARHHLLRLGVALYGLRLTFGAIAALGLGGVVVPLVMLVATLLFGTWVGSAFFGLSRREAILVSAGSAVCGAAAAIAVSSVVRTDDKQTAVAVATGTMNAQEAFIGGRIKLMGDQQLLLDSVPVFAALDSVFSKVRERTDYA